MVTTKRAGAEPIEQRVVDAALEFATEVGWEQVRLSTIADRIQLPLAEIGRHFRDLDAIANAWFARARLAMLALPAEELAGRPAGKRIALAFSAWLDSRFHRYRLFEAVTRVLARVAADAPTVLILDDLQWADTSTALLLSHLLQDVEPMALSPR